MQIHIFVVFIGDDIIRVITTTSTVSSAATDSPIYFEACATAYYNSNCCKQLLDHSGNEFQSGAVDIFGINDNFLQCWRKIASPYYFMSISGNDGWASQKIEIQFRSSKKVCDGGWLDGNDDTHGKVTLRRSLNCEGNILHYFYVNTNLIRALLFRVQNCSIEFQHIWDNYGHDLNPSVAFLVLMQIVQILHYLAIFGDPKHTYPEGFFNRYVDVQILFKLVSM